MIAGLPNLRVRVDRDAIARYGINVADVLDAVEADLDALDSRLASAAEAITDDPLVFSHPVYQYLIARYNLNGRQVHWEPDVEPDAKMWSELGHLLDHHGAEWMIWEGEPGGRGDWQRKWYGIRGFFEWLESRRLARRNFDPPEPASR